MPPFHTLRFSESNRVVKKIEKQIAVPDVRLEITGRWVYVTEFYVEFRGRMNSALDSNSVKIYPGQIRYRLNGTTHSSLRTSLDSKVRRSGTEWYIFAELPIDVEWLSITPNEKPAKKKFPVTIYLDSCIYVDGRPVMLDSVIALVGR